MKHGRKNDYDLAIRRTTDHGRNDRAAGGRNVTVDATADPQFWRNRFRANVGSRCLISVGRYFVTRPRLFRIRNRIPVNVGLEGKRECWVARS